MTDDASAIHADHPPICLMHRHSKLLSCLSLALFPTTCLATAALETGYETAAIATTVQPDPRWSARLVNSRRPLSSPFLSKNPLLVLEPSILFSTIPARPFFLLPPLLPSSQPALSFFPLFSSAPSSHRIATRDTTPRRAVTDSDIRALHHPLLRPFYQPQ